MVKKVSDGQRVLQDTVKSGRPVAVRGKANISKVSEIIESDCRYSIPNLPKLLAIRYRWCILF